MGEAIIARGGSLSLSGGSSGSELKTEIFTSNTVWVAPKAVNQSFSVRIFGGGGGYASAAPAGNGGSGICIIQYYV